LEPENVLMHGVTNVWTKPFRVAAQIAVALLVIMVATGSSMAIAAQDKPAERAVPMGALVIIGGALRTDNAAVWERVVQLAGGKGAKIAVLPTAASNPDKSGAQTVESLNRYGADAFVVPIAPRYKDSDSVKAANDPALAAKVRAATGVYFTGGDQSRITQVLVGADGKLTPVLEAIWQVYRSGGVIAGTSAGAAVMSSTMFYEPPEVLDVLKQGVAGDKVLAPGLGFIGPDVFVDQHLLMRGRFARMLPAMLAKGYKTGLGVDENTAMVVKGGEMEVVGASGVLLVNLSQASQDASRIGFNVKNAKISYLERGDKITLATRQVTAAKAKSGDETINPNTTDFKSRSTDRRFYPAMLGRMTLVELMTHFIDNAQQEVIGLAFDQHSKEPQHGFEFKFRKGPDTVGYATGQFGGNDVTVVNLYLDVQPIEMAQPLYRSR
jgi:cyanophycinase